MTDALTALTTRRSTSVRDMTAPAPTDAELEQILRVATRVPDHGKLCPWRIIILRGEGALKLGALAADRFAKQHPEATEAQIAAEHTRFTRAPLCLAVLSTPQAWHQASVGAGAFRRRGVYEHPSRCACAGLWRKMAHRMGGV